MELVDLSTSYGNLYAPAFSVKLAGRDMVTGGEVAVSQVEVELVLGSASTFSITLSDCYSFKDHAFQAGRGDDLLKLLTFGAEVEMCIGYGDARTTPTAVLGIVTNISTSFPEAGSPELVVSGYDHGYPLSLGTNTDSWRDSRDSDVVQKIATFQKLKAAIDRRAEKPPQIEQKEISDWEFMKKLAERNSDDDHMNHFELYVDPGGTVKRPTLHFGKPQMRLNPVVRLIWGEGLLSFRPEANLAGQVSKVEVFGWDVKTKKPIIGRASANDSGPQAKSVSQLLTALVNAPGNEPTLRPRQPVFTQAEADQRAKAALGE